MSLDLSAAPGQVAIQGLRSPRDLQQLQGSAPADQQLTRVTALDGVVRVYPPGQGAPRFVGRGTPADCQASMQLRGQWVCRPQAPVGFQCSLYGGAGTGGPAVAGACALPVPLGPDN